MKLARLFLIAIAVTFFCGLLWHTLRTPDTTPHLPVVEVEPAPDRKEIASEMPEPVAEPAREVPVVIGKGLVGDPGPVAFKVTPIGEHNRSIKLHTPGFVAVDIGDGMILRLDQGRVNTDKEHMHVPDLPAIVHTYPGVEGMRAVIRILETETVELGDMDIAPSLNWAQNEEGEWAEVRSRDNEVYRTDAAYPAEIVDVQEFKARDQHVVRVAYRPLQYNPVTGVVTHHKAINSVLEFVPIEKTQVDFSSSATEVIDDCDCSERITLEEDLIPPTSGKSTDFLSRWSGADSAACVKIQINQQGIHRLTYNNLRSAGVPASDLVGSNIRMYTRDREIPIKVSRTGTFGSSDWVEFYGEGIRSNFDHFNAYWLGFGGSGTPARFNDTDHRVNVGASIAGAVSVESVCRQQTLDPGTDGGFQAGLNHTDAAYDGWITKYLANFGGNADAHVWNITGTDQLDASRQASISATYRSVLAPTVGDGRDVINVTDLGNNATLASHNVGRNADVGQSDTKTFSTSALTQSSAGTQLRFEPRIANLTYLDTAVLTYHRRLYALSGRLGFGGASGARNYTVRNISTTGTPYLLDVSDPTNPLSLQGFQKSGTTINFGYNAPHTPCLFISAASSTITVPASRIQRVSLHNLADPRRQTDYILIVPEAFEGNEAYDLLTHRAAQFITDESGTHNMNVLVASVESIYNEFGYGVKDPQAIKQFIGYAYHHFQEPKPKYVLLAGDAYKDPTVPNNSTYPDYIPSKYQRTSFVFTATDQWFAMVDGPDEAPDIAMGRLPINSLAEFAEMNAKMKSFEQYGQPAWRRKILLVADETDKDRNGNVPICPPADYPKNCHPYFQVQDEIDLTVIPSTITTTKQYLQSGGGNAGVLNETIADTYRDGAFAINYIGHGSKGQWGKNTAFYRSENADGNNFPPFNFNWTNSRLPLISIYTCLNGEFHTPDGSAGDSCVERFLRRPGQGAAGAVAPTGLAQTRAGRTLCMEFYNAVFNDKLIEGVCDPTQPQPFDYQITGYSTSASGTQRIGDCMLNSFNALCYDLGEMQELKFYHLFMDPATRHGF